MFLFASCSKFVVTLSSSLILRFLFLPGNFPCGIPHIFENLTIHSVPKFQKNVSVGLFHSLSWDPHGLFSFEIDILCFSLGIFSSFFFDDYIFPVFLFSFSHSHFLLVGPPIFLLFEFCLLFHIFYSLSTFALYIRNIFTADFLGF